MNKYSWVDKYWRLTPALRIAVDNALNDSTLTGSRSARIDYPGLLELREGYPGFRLRANNTTLKGLNVNNPGCKPPGKQLVAVNPAGVQSKRCALSYIEPLQGSTDMVADPRVCTRGYLHSTPAELSILSICL